MELQELRNEINAIDGEMLALLERRLAVCRGIAECKRENGLPVRDAARETEKLHEAMERGGAAGQRLVALLSGRVGRVLKMESADVHKASDWFAAHGWPSVFYCRCIPILRSLISIPAGMAGMHPAPFLLLTTVGSLLWNILLVYLGALAGQSAAAYLCSLC